jgi:hypothetical protein
MPITATCPSCTQMCQVEDQYAGMMVKCPKCGNIIQVARPEAAVIPAAAPLAAAPLPPAPPPPPASSAPGVAPGPVGPGFMETLQQSIKSLGLDPLSVNLLYAGTGCLAGLVLFTFFPWAAIGPISVLGMSLWYGIFNFLLSAGAIAFLIVALVVLKKKETFDISLWVAGGWSALASLWRLFDVANIGSLASLGLYLTLLASLGAAGTFGFIIFQRFIKKKM